MILCLPDSAAFVVEDSVVVVGSVLGVEVVEGSEVTVLAGGWLDVGGAPAADWNIFNMSVEHRENTNKERSHNNQPDTASNR